MSDEEHWNAVYASPSESLGWYEPEPSTLGLVIAHSCPEDALIDVGGGDSRLIDNLIDLGYHDLSVFDLSAVVLDRARTRLGSRGSAVDWIEGDVTRFDPDRTWDVWHDRAVFHFLIEEGRREEYRSVLRQAIPHGGRLVIATFGPGAPDRCAGLPVAHYDSQSLIAAFASDFEPIIVGDLAQVRTGEGDQRPYVAGVFERSAKP